MTAVLPADVGTSRPFDWRSAGQSIAQRVHELARRDPDRLAVYDPDAELTRAALDRAAGRVADALHARRGAGPEAVMLLLDLGAPAVAAALGVARAGKHFVAVEASFAPARIAQIAEDAAASVVLTDAAHCALAREATGGRALLIDLAALDVAAAAAPVADYVPDAMFLLNYTSGSTGKPKGVMQTQRSALAQACRYANTIRLGEADRLASFGSLAWAGSYWDVFGALCLGAAAGVCDVRRLGIDALGSWLARTRASVVSGMTVARRLAFDFPELRLPEVRLVQLGGDTVYRRDVEACQRVFPNAVMAVGLGISEAGRIAQQFIAPGERVAHDVVPVGFPTPGVAIELIGEDGSAVAPGGTGEIVAVSDEHAAGYRNLPQVSAERFRRAPGDAARVRYFTGDLGRMLPDGKLQHMGRKDFQIKVQGYTIAANEVDAKLLEVEGVREACVVARQSAAGVDELVAFLVRDTPGTPPAEALRERLRASLPEHMVPRRVVDLDALPRTPTGKVDRNRLPELRVARRDLATACVAPTRPFEAEIAVIWADVLGLDAVGVDDDFLALGGDSLGALQIGHRVTRSFGVDVPFAALLARATVAAMAALVAAATDGAAQPAPLTRRAGA